MPNSEELGRLLELLTDPDPPVDPPRALVREGGWLSVWGDAG